MPHHFINKCIYCESVYAYGDDLFRNIGDPYGIEQQKRQKQMKKSIWIRIIIYGILACVSLYVYRFRIYDLINKIAYNDYAMEELTEEQKIEDFEYIYSNMVNSIPFLEEIKELYQIDFEGRKEYYLEEIRSTNNNFEFYCTLKAIMRDIPSFSAIFC